MCQKLIPLIAYAKCQLCSLTCHSTCSSANAPTKAQPGAKAHIYTKNGESKQPQQLAVYDPLKYCHINYLISGLDYNNYIGKLVGMRLSSCSSLTTSGPGHRSASNNLVADYLFVKVDQRWKRLWIVLRLDQPQLDLYQTRANHKPFDSIQLLNDQVTIETDMKRIRKLLGAAATATSDDLVAIDNDEQHSISLEENIYEELSQSQQQQSGGKHQQLINFERSSLIILLLGAPKLCLQIGFNSFNKKNIWFDALQSVMLLGLQSGGRILSASRLVAGKATSGSEIVPAQANESVSYGSKCVHFFEELRNFKQNSISI